MQDLFQTIESYAQAPLGVHWFENIITVGINITDAHSVDFFFYDMSLCLEEEEYSPVDAIVLEMKDCFGSFWGARAKVMPTALRKLGVAIRIWRTLDDIKKAYWIIDPYMRESLGGASWGKPLFFEFTNAHARMTPKSKVLNPSCMTRRLQIIRPEKIRSRPSKPDRPRERTIIYECHTRGATKHSSAQFAGHHAGTFRGLIDMIPHLKELGVTAIELLPIFDFDENENPFTSPTGERLYNFWGYSPINFFALKQSYAYDQNDPCSEFKLMVDCFHDERIEVILDVVYNHTAEGGEGGVIDHFKVQNLDWYHHIQGYYQNYSGCGNSVNASHTVMRQMIIDSLCYWANEMGVDGFRFDLATVLNREVGGDFNGRSALFRAIDQEPRLENIKIIAEPWDAAGGYQIGHFAYHANSMEWNGKYRDIVRCAVRGDHGMLVKLKNAILGSPDIYQSLEKGAVSSVNFVTSHDGFTLWDWTAYESKRNEANGEQNRDGTNDNYSQNCGVEGETDDVQINQLRHKKVCMTHLIMMLSSGIPMILAGDEFGRTQKGNNNAYCLDNEISWINWELKDKHDPMFRFVQNCISFRREYREFFSIKHSQYQWFNSEGYEEDLGHYTRTLAFQISNQSKKSFSKLKFYVAFNFHNEPVTFTLPEADWKLVLDSSLEDKAKQLQHRVSKNSFQLPSVCVQVFKAEV